MTDTTTLRADLAAMEQRALEAEATAHAQVVMNNKLYREREGIIAELRAAESALASLRGEVILFRDALQAAEDYADHYTNCDDCSADSLPCDKAIELLGREAILRRKALTATRTSAALGALVEAALKRRRARLAVGDVRHPDKHPREYAEVLRAMVDAEKIEDAAADAVLAMGKEGA